MLHSVFFALMVGSDANGGTGQGGASPATSASSAEVVQDQRAADMITEAVECMTMVGSTVHCFSCTCRACGQEVSTHDVECHTCHFRVCPGCTTDGICTSCVERCRPSDPPSPKKRQFRREWLLTRSWLRYEATTDKMWCIACQQYPQLGHSVPFVQGTSNFMLCTLKHHQRSSSHAVSLALSQSGGRVT